MTDGLAAKVRAVLVADWDPIGVKELLRPSRLRNADEYDSYIGGIVEPLSAGASRDELAGHLHQIERERMGSRRDRRTADAAAEKLAGIAGAD